MLLTYSRIAHLSCELYNLVVLANPFLSSCTDSGVYIFPCPKGGSGLSTNYAVRGVPRENFHDKDKARLLDHIVKYRSE